MLYAMYSSIISGQTPRVKAISISEEISEDNPELIYTQ